MGTPCVAACKTPSTCRPRSIHSRVIDVTILQNLARQIQEVLSVRLSSLILFYLYNSVQSNAARVAGSCEGRESRDMMIYRFGWLKKNIRHE